MITAPEAVLRTEDLSDLHIHFPMLKDKAVLGKGVFSRVYEGSKPDTCYKLTMDAVYCRFMKQYGNVPGIPRLHRFCGDIPSPVHDRLYLLEIQRLMPLRKWDHERLILERNALMHLVDYRVDVNEREVRTLVDWPGRLRHAAALTECRDIGIFSESIRSALTAIALFMTEEGDDLLLDLMNPQNYMTDGQDLYITDPFNLIM